MAVPLVFATAMMGLIMWWLDISLDMATASIGALAINAATDFSLYFVIAYQKLLDDYAADVALEKAIQQEGATILADCVLNTLCFLPLIASGFLPVRQLGWMMGVMLLASAIATLIFMAALLPRCTRQRGLRPEDLRLLQAA
jgi:predicted RND superfamily exporter protein